MDFHNTFFKFSPIGNFWNLFICGIITTIAGFTMAKENIMDGRWTGYLGIGCIMFAFFNGYKHMEVLCGMIF